MYAAQVLLFMLLFRLVIPFGLLLWIGESVRRHSAAACYGGQDQA